MKNNILKSLLVIGTVFVMTGCGGESSSPVSDVSISLPDSIDESAEETVSSDEMTPTLTADVQDVIDAPASTLTADVQDAIDAPASTLTQDLKDAITFMYNEEGLAYDVYMNVNKELVAVYDINVSTLHNIAQNAETQHMAWVDALAVKYDLNMTTYDPTLEPYGKEGISSGTYTVPHIQELYDLLYTKGIKSKKDALEVGCMIEVVDIDDLNDYILLAEGSNAQDVLSIFHDLRQGSYNHYWSFNKALQKLNDPNGVDDLAGCCSVQEALSDHNWCHISDYPPSTSGNGK